MPHVDEFDEIAEPVRTRRKRRRKLDVDKADIVDRVLNFFDVEDTARGFEKEARIQRYAKYRMWTEGKDWPWKDASDFPLPDIMEKSMRMQDTLHNAVMASRPVISANAMDKADGEKERTIDNLIDFQVFVEQEGEEKIGDLVDAFINDGVFVAFIPWVKETRETMDLKLFDPIPAGIIPIDYFGIILTSEFDSNSLLPVERSDGWDWLLEIDGEKASVSFYTRPDDTVEMVISHRANMYDGPLVIQKEWDEVLYPPRAANLHIPGPSNPHGAAHVLLVDFPTVDEVIRLAKDDTYDLLDKEDLEALKNVSPDDANREMRDQKDTIQGVTTEDGTGDKKAPKHKTLTRIMCFDVFDVGSGSTQDVVWWVIKETKSLARAKFLTEVFPSNPPRRPLVHRSMLPIRGRVGGISFPEMMEGLHDVAKTVLDQTIDAGTIKNVPFFFYRPSGSMKPEIISLAPGQGYPLQDPQRDINFPNFGNTDQTFGLNIFTMIMQMEEKLTLIGDIQEGRVPQGGSSALRTVGGMALLAAQGEARPERILRRFFSGLTEVWSHIHELNQHFLPDKKKIRVIGLKDTSEDPYQDIQRTEVTGRFEFDFKANVLNTSRAALQQSTGELMSVYISELFLQLGIIDANGIYKLAREFGFAQGQDPDQYLIAPSPDSMKRKIFAEEAITAILDSEIPDGVPAEGGGAAEHLQKLTEFMQDDKFGLLNERQVEVFKVYVQQVGERMAQEQQQAALMAAAQNFQSGRQQGNGAGRPPVNPPQNPNAQAPLQPGQLRDQSLPGAGGGAGG